MRSLVILLTAFSILAFSKVRSTDNWEICFNKQSIFKGTDDQLNKIAFLKAAGIEKNDCITITYKMENVDTGWKRTFYINDSADNNIKTIVLNKQTGSVSVNASVLQEMIDKKQPVFIYTTSLPKDPSKAAVVRVRRIFLCKIEWN